MFARWKTPPKKNDHRTKSYNDLSDINDNIDINGDGYVEVVMPRREENIIFAGYLLRPLLPSNSGGNGHYIQTWKEMWTVLRSDNTMYYYEDEHSTKPINAIHLNNIDVRITEEVYPDKYCFEVVTPLYVYQFMANSFNEMRVWAEILRRHSSVSKENALIEQTEQTISDRERQKNTLNPNEVLRESQDVRMKYYNQVMRRSAPPLRSSQLRPQAPPLLHTTPSINQKQPNISPPSPPSPAPDSQHDSVNSIISTQEERNKSPNSPQIQRKLLNIDLHRSRPASPLPRTIEQHKDNDPTDTSDSNR